MAFCSDFLCHQGGDLLGCSVGGLRAGSEATGVRLRGERVFALSDHLRGNGFPSDSAIEASLGPLTLSRTRPMRV